MANRYGCRKVLHDAGFEIPYEYVPDGIRGPVHDIYPSPGLRHYRNFMILSATVACCYKGYRVILARGIYYQKHPNRRSQWRMPFRGTGKAFFL